MKHFFFLAFLGHLFILTSCKKEGCTDNMAINYEKRAKTDDGSCSYVTDKFEGRFSGIESCSDITDPSAIVDISRKNESSDQIILDNFTRYAISPIATVSGNSFTIATQSHPSGFLNINISGSGIINGNSLTINFITSESGEQLGCDFTGDKVIN